MAEEVTFSERPDKTFNVRAFGAKGDGKTDDWRALQQAIAFACNKTGGEAVQLTCDFAKVNNVAGRFGFQAPAEIEYKITTFYSRRHSSWMVSHTVPVQ